MRHNKKGRKLGRTSQHRKMLLRNLLTSLILYNRIETTVEKSKELVSFADKFLNKVRDGSLSAKRYAFKYLTTKQAGKKLFNEIIKSMDDRKSGLVRTIKTYERKGDAAKMAIVEFTFIAYTPKQKKSKKEKEKKK
jgi:large subunit ribosomal protein L17